MMLCDLVASVLTLINIMPTSNCVSCQSVLEQDIEVLWLCQQKASNLNDAVN